MHGRTKELVNVFTSAKNIEQKRLEREKMKELGIQIGTSILLTAGAIGGVVPVTGFSASIQNSLKTTIAVEKVVSNVNAGLGLVTGSYLAVTGLVGKARDNLYVFQPIMLPIALSC
jgi:hypothetical protein